MFSVVSAYGIRKSPGSQWGVQDISTMPAKDAFVEFRTLYLTLTPQGMDNIVVDIEVLASEYAGHSETFAALLATRSTAITPTTTLPSYKATRAVYTDIHRAGYTTDRAVPGGAVGSVADPVDKVELQLSRPNTDMAIFAKRCLVSVNGFFHRVQANSRVAYVTNGARSIATLRKNYIGMLSFQAIGDIRTYPITSAQIFPSAELSPLKNGVHIDFEAEDLTGKSVILVIGGYLHFAESGIFSQIGAKTFSVHPNRLPLLARYAESRDTLDLSGMQNPPTDANDRAIDAEKLLSDESLRYYFTHENSFFVVVDTPNLTTVRSEIHSLRIPGKFFAYRDPKEVMLVGAGRCAEYWPVHEDGIWAVNIDPEYYGTKMFEGLPSLAGKMTCITGGINTTKGLHNQRGVFLDIIADSVTA